MGIAAAMGLLQCARAQHKVDTVPFVGCPADGQEGYVPPPQGQPKPVSPQGTSLEAIAYYKSEYVPGVFAPRGWHCRAWYGSSGSNILVTLVPIDTAHFMPSKVGGPGVEMSTIAAGTSGRLSVARYASRLFPQALGVFIARVKSEGIAPVSDFDPRNTHATP